MISPTKNSIQETMYNNTASPITDSPAKTPTLIRYQSRFESPSERDDGLKSPSSPRETSTFSTEKCVKENFVLLDQDDFSQGIEVIRTKIGSIEDEMKSMQTQYSRFQEKVSGSIVNLQKNLDSFLNSIEFSTVSRWKGRKREEFLQSLEISIKNEKLEEIHHLLNVYRTGLKQNIFDFKDQALRNAVDQATKLFQEKLNFIQNLESIEREIQIFIDDIYNNIDTHIVNAISFGCEKLRLSAESFDQTFSKNVKLFSSQFGKETSVKVNKIQKLLDESLKLIDMITAFVLSVEKVNQHDLEIYYSHIPSDMIRLLKLSHGCLSSFANAIEKRKALINAIQNKDTNQVKIIYNSFSNELEKIVASDTLKGAQTFLSNNDTEHSLIDSKERRKKEVVQRIKNIIEKSETFSAEKQQKFTQILLESGIRDPTVLKELRMAWETKRSRIFDDKYNKEHLLQTFTDKLQSAINSKDLGELEAAIIVPDGIKSEVEKWQNLRCQALTLLDSLLSVSIEELDIKCRLETMLQTKDLSKFYETQRDIRKDFKNSEILGIWNDVCELKQKQDECLKQLDLSLDSSHFCELLSSIAPDFDENFVTNQYKLWEKHWIQRLEVMMEEAISEKEESKLQTCLDIIEKEDSLKPSFIVLIDQINTLLNSIHENRIILENAIKTREKSNLEEALSKGKRYSKSLSECLGRANSLLLQLEREEELLEKFEIALKQKNLDSIQSIIITIENSSEVRDFNLLPRAKQVEREMQLFIELETKIIAKDFTNIVETYEQCKDCKEFSDEIMLNYVDFLINQNQISKNKILNQFQSIQTSKMLETYLEQFDSCLSEEDVSILTNQWKSYKETHLVGDFELIIQSGNDRLLDLWNQKVCLLEEKSQTLCSLQQKANTILEEINNVRKLMTNSISTGDLSQMESIFNFEGTFLETEREFLKSKIDKFKHRNLLLGKIDNLLNSDDLNVSSLDEAILQLSEQDNDLEILNAMDKLLHKKQSVIMQNTLLSQINIEIERKNTYGNLSFLIEKAQKIPALSHVSTKAEQFLRQQIEFIDELRKTFSQQLESRKLEQNDFQKYYEYLPSEEVDSFINQLRVSIIALHENQEKFMEFKKHNDKVISEEYDSLTSKLKDTEIEQKKTFENEKIRMEEDLKKLLETEKFRIELAIQNFRELHENDLEKLKLEEVDMKKRLDEEFLKSRELLFQKAENDRTLFQQQLKEVEMLLESSLQTNLILSQSIERIREDISQKEAMNSDMKLYIKSLEETYKNLVELEPQLANEERDLSESISQLEEKIELQKENICLFREKLEEQNLMLQDKILYKNMVEEKLKKKHEEVHNQIEESTLLHNSMTKELSFKEEQKKEIERHISEVQKSIDIETKSVNELSSKRDVNLLALNEIINNRKDVELELERIDKSIKDAEHSIYSLESIKKEKLDILEQTKNEEKNLESFIEGEETKIQDLSNRIKGSEYLLTEKRGLVDKNILDVANIEHLLREKEDEYIKLVEVVESVRSKVEKIKSQINDEGLVLDSYKTTVEELNIKLKERVKMRETYEEDEKKLKDQLFILEEDIRLMEKTNSDKTDIVEKLRGDSKLKTLEKLEMLKKLEEEEERSLQEAIIKAEESLKTMKGKCKNARDIEEKLVKEQETCQTQYSTCSEKIKNLENDILHLENEIRDVEISTSTKQQLLQDLAIHSKDLENKIRLAHDSIEKETNSIGKLETDISNCTLQLVALRDQKSSLNNQYSSLKDALERESIDIESTSSYVKKLQDTLTENLSKKENLQYNLEDLTGKQIQLSELITELEVKFSSQQSSYKESLKQQSELESKIQELTIKYENQKSKLQDSILQLEKEKLEKEKGIEILHIKVKDCERSLELISNKEIELIEQQKLQEYSVKEKELIIESLEKSISELEKKVDTLDKQEVKLNQALENVISSDDKEEPVNINEIAKVVEETNDKIEKKDEDDNQVDKEKKKAVLPSKSNKTQTYQTIETIDSILSTLYKKVSKGELKLDDENKVILNYNDQHFIEISRQYSLILSDQCNIGHNTPTFLFNIIIPKFVDFIMNSIKKESETSTQNKLKKLLKKLRGFKKSFSDLELPKSLDKEYFTLSVLYVYYLNANGCFSKDFWEVFLSSTEFLKEFFSPTSILYNTTTKDDLLFLTKKQSKFKLKNINLFEASADIQQSISDQLLIDFPNSPPIESLKSVLAEIKCKINMGEEMKKIVTRKLSRSLLSILEVGFRAFKFFGRYYFWDYVKFYVEKGEKTQGEIKDIYHNINEMVSNAKIKLTEPNDAKFVLFIINAFNKRKLAEWFKKLSSLSQIGDYFTEESIIRSDKMHEIVSLLENVELSSKSYMVDVECVEDFTFNYEKCIWNE